MSTTRLSRTLGALIGVHAGDALGATLEFTPWDRIRRRYPDGLREIVGGGPFAWPAGHATDDTDLTRAVLLAYQDSITAPYGSLDIAKAAANHMADWITGSWPSRTLGSRPVDIGNATLIGLSRYQDTSDPRTCGAGAGQAGNGSLMRCIPTGLFGLTSEARRRESADISGITHNDPRCTVSCAVYNEIVAQLLEGRSVPDAVEVGLSLADEMDCPAVVAAVRRAMTISLAVVAAEGPGKDFPGKAGGFVLESLMLAIAAVLDPRSFEDVLVDVVRVGSDTDTNGAIAGGLLGARDGVECVPQRWMEKLQFRSEFECIARRILEAQRRL